MTHWTLLRNFIDANQASIELRINRYSHITTDKLHLRCVTAKSCLSRRTHNTGIIDTFNLFWDYGVSFQKRWDPTSGVAECCLLTYSTRCRPMWLTVLHLRVSRESSPYRNLRSVPRSSSSPFPWTATYLIRSPIPSGAPLLLQPESCKRNCWTSTIMNNVLLSKSIPLQARPATSVEHGNPCCSEKPATSFQISTREEKDFSVDTVCHSLTLVLDSFLVGCGPDSV